VVFFQDITGAQVKHPEGRNWGWYGDRRHAFEFPEQLAVQIIRANLAAAAGDYFSSLGIFPNEGRGPIALFLRSIHAPNLTAGFLVEGDEERLLLIVVDDIKPILVQD